MTIDGRVTDMPSAQAPTKFKQTSLSFRTLSHLHGAVTSLFVLLGVTVFVTHAPAEVRSVTATGEYRMTDRDTKEDAIRLAMEEAKRNALDQVASYLEAVTVVRNFDVTQDEIRSYTAGVVVVLDQKVRTSLDNETVVIHAALTAQVDTDEVAQALTAVKQHEEARRELASLKEELDQLHQDLNAANQALASATSSEQVQQYKAHRQELLSQAQSNAMVAQAWTNWIVLLSPLAYPSLWGGLPQINALVAAAGQLNPNNPHLYTIQETLARQTVAPRQPPMPPMPHTVPVLPRMPTYQVVPRQPLAQPPAGESTGFWNKPSPARRLDNVYQHTPPVPGTPDLGSQGRPPTVIQQMTPPQARPPSLHTVPHLPPQPLPSKQGQSSSDGVPSQPGTMLQPRPQPRTPDSLSPQLPQSVQSPDRQGSNPSGSPSGGTK